MGALRPDEHENRLTEGVRPRTAALLVAGSIVGALGIGTMSLTLSPADPPAVEPIQVGSPTERDRSLDGEAGRDRVDPRRRAEKRARLARQQRRARRGGRTAPPAAQPAQPSPGPAMPRAAPMPRPAPARPSPPPRRESQPRSPPRSAPQPQPVPPPPADDDDAGVGDNPGVDD